MQVEIGILSAPFIEYCFPLDGHGDRRITAHDGDIAFPPQPFVLYNVAIGIDFHWERRGTQEFDGALRFIHDGEGNVVAVNTIDLEDYLLSVISSEMKATAGLEFLKAHAIISRSWVISQILSRRNGHREASPSPEGLIRWWDHEDHTLFDVCADDHCQRYQGRQMAVGANVAEAIRATRGMVLSYGGEICDARFSKCCGGRTERFGACWEDRDLPYLQSVEDPWCNTHDQDILSTVLNDYDLETRDFFSWEVRYTREELSALFLRKSGVNVGTVLDLRPLQRGASGRIVRLEVVGSIRSVTIGKELMIRRCLGETHLKSSAFEVERTPEGDFILHGRGWGHGVGLCQIGAAVMASEGASCEDILSHYYPGAEIVRYEE